MSQGSNRQFLRNVLTLTKGTSIAQTIPIATAPLLSRLYGPDDFGIFALYATLAALISIAATGRYDLAVMLPHDDDDADALVSLSIVAAAGVSLVLLIVAVAYREPIAVLLGEPRIAQWLLILPISVFLISAYSALNYWLNRQQRYSRMGRNRVLQTGTAGAGQVGLGYLHVGAAGLISGSILGHLLTTGLLGWTFLQHRTRSPQRGLALRFRALAAEFRNHPLHILPAQWASMAALQIPIIVITHLAGATATGLYSLAMYLISIPTNMIAAAIGDVYRERASVAYRERGEFRSLYLTTVWFAFRVAVIPLAALYWLAPELFAFVLGDSWRTAGLYARLLAVSAFFQFVFTSVDKGAVIVGATRYIAGWSFARLFSFAAVGALAVTRQWRVEAFIVATVVVNSVLYAFDASYQYYLSGARSARVVAS